MTKTKTRQLKEMILKIEAALPYKDWERERYGLAKKHVWTFNRLQFFCDRLAEFMATSSVTLYQFPVKGDRCWTVSYSPWGVTAPGDRGWFRTPLEALQGIHGLLEMGLWYVEEQPYADILGK